MLGWLVSARWRPKPPLEDSEAGCESTAEGWNHLEDTAGPLGVAWASSEDGGLGAFGLCSQKLGAPSTGALVNEVELYPCFPCDNSASEVSGKLRQPPVMTQS